MRSIPLKLGLVLVFALAVGDFAFRTLEPSLHPDYRIGGVVAPLSAADNTGGEKHLYLRQTWTMTEAPTAAWLKVMGHDVFELYVNGRLVSRTQRVGIGRTTGAIADITRLVHVGENTIAIHAAQLTVDRPPRVAATGMCEFADGSTLVLDDPNAWRAANYYDRRGGYWYQTEFVDDHWKPAHVGAPETWSAQVAAPPGSIVRPHDSAWVSAPDAGRNAYFAREFELEDAPRTGWMRLAATSVARVAVNGSVILSDDSTLATPIATRPTLWTLELGPYLRAGKNTVAVAVSGGGESPRIRADLEATARDGTTTYVATDDAWLGGGMAVGDWRTVDPEAAAWSPCAVESGYQGVVPRAMVRIRREASPGVEFTLGRAARYAGVLLLVGLLGWSGARQTYRVAETTFTESGPCPLPESLPYAALVPSAVLALTGALMTWDVAWSSDQIYTPLWLLTLVAIVPIQWLLMLSMVRQAPAPASSEPGDRLRRLAFTLAWGAVIAGALWLRLRDLTAEPIHHDEVTAYMFTMSIFEHGFPGGQVHPDIPFGYCATSELSFYPNALCALFVDDPLLVIRVPAVAFSMATLLLIGWVGTRWFSAETGLVAAALFAVAPHAIGMADFGRYLAMVQFFTLLAMYFAYEASRGEGPMRVGMLWAATLSFIAMYLSWEGTGIFGVGLAAATTFQRRRNLRSVLMCPSLYLATLAVGAVAIAQHAHRVNQQTQRLWYGEGISSLSLKPMWRYPFFDADFYLINSSWTKDALLPMIGIGVAATLAVSHRWRRPIRFSLISLVSNAMLMTALLPLTSNRYAYHLTEIVILLYAASMVAGAEALVRAAASARAPALRGYAQAVAAFAVIVGTVAASGWAIRTSEMKNFVTGALTARQLRIPDWIGPTRYVKENMKEGDVIISLIPHAQNYVFNGLDPGSEQRHYVDYWLESRLVIQATLGDAQDVPLDRRSGAPMLYDIEQVKRLFADHDRVWYCTMRYAQSRVNETEVSRYLRQHMDVVYEDFATAVLLRDKNHRPAPVREEEDEAGRLASDYYLK